MSAPRRSVSGGSSGRTSTDSTFFRRRSVGRNGNSMFPSLEERRQGFTDAHAKFQSHRKEYEREAADGRTFVLVEPLTDELKRTGVMDEMRCRTNDLVTPIATSKVPKIDLPGYTIVFFILVEIGFPHLFSVFRGDNVDDSKLPLAKDRLERLVCQYEDKAHTFVKRFLAEQVAWCPIRFSSEMSLGQDNRIEPFRHKSRIRSSRGQRPLPANNAKLFEVHIPEKLLSEDTRHTLDDLGACITSNLETETEMAGTPRVNDDKCYRVALKQFPSKKRETFERERNAFKTLRDNNDGLIQYIASYHTTNDKQETHYNILLEYAELDLYQVMHKEEPPVSSDKIKGFWDAILGVCRGLEAIGNVDFDENQYSVWHCDVKPENILRTGGRFKLADLGEARIQRSGPDEEPQAAITGGTMTYAAPEKAAYLNSRVHEPSPVKQNSDVWSLGAVLSNAATFVVLGKQGVLKYNLLRSVAVKEATGKGGDCFHDGDKVLEAVKQWHEYLRGCSRRYDDMTPTILDLVDQHMLVDSQCRWNSAKTADRLEDILKNTTGGWHRAPDLIKRMLEDLEDNPVSFRERSTDSSATSLGTITTGDSVAANDSMSASKYDLLNQQILPTAPQGNMSLRRRNTGTTLLSRTNTRSTTGPEPPLMTTRTRTTAAGNLGERRGSSEELEAPYTVFNLREALNESDKEGKSMGGRLGGMSLRRRRTVSVRGKWKEDQLEGAFKGRDIIFLIDNGSTMRGEWQEATELLEALVRRAIGYDEDGIELYFTNQKDTHCSAVELRKQQDVADFRHAMGAAKPTNRNYPPQMTNIVPWLSTMMGKYLYEKKKKPKTIIVFTDGRWCGMTDEYAVDNLIVNNLKHLRTIHSDTAASGNISTIEATRPLTIQFVRFGEDPDGSDRLRRLDDCLVEHGVEDVVDCEPSRGDVYKMFLGSLLKEMDEKVNTTNALSPTSPSLSRGPSMRNGTNGTAGAADDAYDNKDRWVVREDLGHPGWKGL